MKKIMLLGGSAQQITAINYARQQGYHTILCDYLPDNPGQDYSDKFYQVSTTDKEAILKVAKEENIDGIVAYASDPAAPTAAFVAEKLGLPTNPFHSVEILAFKDKFREFLLENNFSTPKSNHYASAETALEELSIYEFPIMVKPIDSSGSKGVSKITSPDNVQSAIEDALFFSRSKVFIIEEYVEKDHEYLVGGDCFVQDGRVVYWGLLNCHRDPNVNPLVPVGKSYPLLLEDYRIKKVKEVIERIVKILDIQFGGFNLEVIVDNKDRVFVVEMGPRNGGNMIPELLNHIHGVDMIKATVELAVGNDLNIVQQENNGYFSSYNLHTSQNGILEKVKYDSEVKGLIFNEAIFKNPGSEVEYFDGSNKAIGIVFMEFDNSNQMYEIMDLTHEWYSIQLVE